MILFYGYEKLLGVPEDVIWNQHYHMPHWQSVFDIANSIPVFVVFAAIGLALHRKTVVLFCLSAIIHCILDFLVHRNDSHRHFYPLSDFRFSSPVSYWDPAHYGSIVSSLEVALFALLAVWLWWLEKKETIGNFTLTRLRSTILLTSVVYVGFFVFVVSMWMGM